MIRVTVELIPFGREEDASVLSRMLIANTGVGDYITGHYAAITEINNEQVKAEVTDFRRKDGEWALIHKVLQAEQCPDSMKLIFERLSKRLVK